jgi:hypothetical protein
LYAPHCSGSGPRGYLHEDLSNLRLAAMLSHDRFIGWSKGREKSSLFTVQLKKLLTFFNDID